MEAIQMCQIKLHLILVTIGTLFLLGSKGGMASDCYWAGPFLENTEQADLIVRGKILTSNEATLTPTPSLEIEVLEVYKGTFNNSKLRIVYYPSYGIFLVGTEWILALKQGSIDNDKYMIPDCWGSYLKIEPLVVGNLNDTAERDAKQTVSLDEFKNLLQGEEFLPLLSNYEEGVQAGLRQCNTWYTTKSGRLSISAVDVLEASGNIITYEVLLNQIESSFAFELDLNSVKAHQQ
jgi:hypothetical protein